MTRMKNLLYTHLFSLKWSVFSIFVICIFKEIRCHHLHIFEGSSSAQAINSLLDIADSAIHEAKKNLILKSRYENELFHPMDCAEILKDNATAQSGLHKIWPHSRVVEGPVHVFCDMTDDGGAWTVLQRRGDFDSGKEYFYRDWESYKNGFGDPAKDFWIGNDVIFALTNERKTSLKFTLSDWEGNSTYAAYDDFWMDDEDHKYMAHVAGYRGTAGDSFSFTNGVPFSTKDKDNDQHASSCAVMFKGAWWYTSCHSSNLNGNYLKGAHESYADGVEWSAFRGQHYSLKDTVIKIRPKGFIKQNKEVVELDVTPE